MCVYIYITIFFLAVPPWLSITSSRFPDGRLHRPPNSRFAKDVDEPMGGSMEYVWNIWFNQVKRILMEYIYIWLLLWNIYGIIYGRSKFQWYFLTVIMTGIGESSCATHGTLDKMDNMTEIYDWNIWFSPLKTVWKYWMGLNLISCGLTMGKTPAWMGILRWFNGGIMLIYW